MRPVKPGFRFESYTDYVMGVCDDGYDYEEELELEPPLSPATQRRLMDQVWALKPQMSAAPETKVAAASAEPNLVDLLEGVKEMGGRLDISFSGYTCKVKVTLPGATLTYTAAGETEHEALLAFAKKFQPTWALFAEQFAASYNKQMEEALSKFILTSQNPDAEPRESEPNDLRNGGEESGTGTQE